MGKVRIALVKRTARRLLETYPDMFTDSFEENKKLVAQLVDAPSKKIRNQIAGYITHLIKIRKKREEIEEKIKG